MTIHVDPALPEDAEALADLIEELETFYGAPPSESRDRRVAQIQRILFGASPAGHVLLARDGRRLAGMAAYSYLWPAAGASHSLFIKELYVRETARRHGVGKILMARLRDIASEQGCSRVEWMTESNNVQARAFYRTIEESAQIDKIVYRQQL